MFYIVSTSYHLFYMSCHILPFHPSEFNYAEVTSRKAQVWSSAQILATINSGTDGQSRGEAFKATHPSKPFIPYYLYGPNIFLSINLNQCGSPRLIYQVTLTCKTDYIIIFYDQII